VVTLLAVLGAVWVHGPGFAHLDSGDVLLIQGWPGDRVASEPGPTFWLPLLQTARPISLQSQRVHLELDGRLAEGVRTAGGAVRLRWTPTPDDVPALVARWGDDPTQWNAAARGVLAVAWVQATSGRDATQNTVDQVVATALAKAGVRVDDLQVPKLRFTGATAQVLAEVSALKQRTQTALAEVRRDAQTTEQRREGVLRVWRTRKAALVTELAEAQSAARQSAATARAEADQYRVRTEREATAQRDARIAQVQVHAEARRLRAQALAVRAAALERHGERLVEQAIARKIMPQLVRLGAGYTPKEAAEGVNSGPPPVDPVPLQPAPVPAPHAHPKPDPDPLFVAPPPKGPVGPAEVMP
jgi:hypothetical protein